MMIRTVAALTLVIGLGTAVLAANPDDKAKDPRICRAGADTGTHIRSSECHRKSEWPAIDEARHKQYEELNKQVDAPGILSPASNSPYPH